MINHRIPLLSVGLLVHNGEKYLTETIDSILAQTFKDFDLIISDNASADGTERICRSYLEQDSRIRYHRQTENIGAIRNFNFLVSQARGKYFKWAAADDLIAPTFLARCIEVLETCPEFVLCHTQTVTIDSDGNELYNGIICSSGAAEQPEKGNHHQYRPARRFKQVLLGNTAVMDQWAVFRIEVLRAAGYRLPYIGHEKVMIANLSLHGRFAEIPKRLFAYRMHLDSISSQTNVLALQDWCSPHSTVKEYPRFIYLRDYLNSVATSELPLTQRLLCYLAIARYLLQVSKWKYVIRDRLFGAKFGRGNAEVVQSNAAAWDTENPRRSVHELWT